MINTDCCHSKYSRGLGNASRPQKKSNIPKGDSRNIELTVPWENRIEEAHERKRLKYEELIAEYRERKWKSWTYACGSRV
jgi:hypothetical protein